MRVCACAKFRKQTSALGQCVCGVFYHSHEISTCALVCELLCACVYSCECVYVGVSVCAVLVRISLRAHNLDNTLL